MPGIGRSPLRPNATPEDGPLDRSPNTVSLFTTWSVTSTKEPCSLCENANVVRLSRKSPSSQYRRESGPLVRYPVYCPLLEPIKRATRIPLAWPPMSSAHSLPPSLSRLIHHTEHSIRVESLLGAGCGMGANPSYRDAYWPRPSPSGRNYSVTFSTIKIRATGRDTQQAQSLCGPSTSTVPFLGS